MFRQHLENVTGLSIYPMISLLVFVAFFIAVTVWVIGVKKSYLKEMEELPLKPDQENV
ncbi:MAG: CcoQ/FixQ family Cbb3-type cytochrome c oxidase assembly chaperone [Bacteroidia bacterium]|nr:CcoQ/FixQ family Cbb3-type cytochrome c oxidase assembly chaperone [Bacteroidia bacterium]